MSKEWSAFCYKFIEREGWKTALSGLSATLRIAVFGLLIGIIIGIIIAAVRLYPKYKLLPKILSGICNVYVAIFRGAPIVVQLLVGYYVLLPAMGVKLDSMIVAIIIFGMNSGAYVSEIMRSGMQAVDPGQMEAARALGLTYNASMMKIVIPQGIKNILPTLGNEFISLIKETSVVSFITVIDLTKAFKQIGDANYEYVIPYLMLAAVYLVLVLMITYIIRILERRLSKVDKNR